MEDTVTNEQHESDAGDAESEQPEQQETVWIGDREFRIQRPQSDAQMLRYSHMEGKMVPA